MPYRIDLAHAPAGALERLIDLGALDVDTSRDGGIAALMPDHIGLAEVTHTLGRRDLTVTAAVGRDEDSVWILSPRTLQIGRLRIVPEHFRPEPGTLRLIDAPAFGTGLHPTTALCLEALDQELQFARPDAVLDVGTGSGVLALAAVMLGAQAAVAIDVDAAALRAAAENVRLNGMRERIVLAQGGPETIEGAWKLVLANVLAAPLIEMAPALVRRVGHHGRLVLSGIHAGVEPDVERVYRRLGMRSVRTVSREGWVALVLQASW